MRIAIIGVGTIGAQAALHLARRGVAVTGYEQFTIGHAYGSAGGDSRFFSRVELNDTRYSEVIGRAEELWRDLNAATGVPLLDFTGGVMMGAPDTVEMQRAIASCELTSTPRSLSAVEVAAEYPDLRLAPGDAVVFDPNAGRIDPELTITLTARMARAAGADIRENVAVREVAARDGGTGVRTGSGWEVYDAVIVTAGAWTKKLLGAEAPETAIRRLTSAWYFPREAARFTGLVPFMRIAPDYVYGLPSADGRSVKIGLGFDSHVVVDDPDAAERWLPATEGLETFRERLAYLPGLAAEPFRVQTYFETYAPNRREYFRETTHVGRTLVLTGFSGHGFKVAPALGEAATLWAVGESHGYPTDMFTA